VCTEHGRMTTVGGVQLSISVNESDFLKNAIDWAYLRNERRIVGLGIVNDSNKGGRPHTPHRQCVQGPTIFSTTDTFTARLLLNIVTCTYFVNPHVFRIHDFTQNRFANTQQLKMFILLTLLTLKSNLNTSERKRFFSLVKLFLRLLCIYDIGE